MQGKVCIYLLLFDERALTWYGKLIWESAHAWNLIILCYLIVWGMALIFMVHLSFYTIPSIIHDVMYDINTMYNTLGYPVIIISKVTNTSCDGRRNVLLNNYIIDKFVDTKMALYIL